MSDAPPHERPPQDQERVRAGYDAVAAVYTERVHDELSNKPLDRGLLTAFGEQIVAEFGPGATVCDIGCGPGHVGAFLMRLGLAVTGIDLSPSMIEHARRLHPDMTFAVGTMTALDIPDGRFAGITAFYSIIHLVSDAEVDIALREYHRVLADRGLLLVAVHRGERGDSTVHADDMLGVAVNMDFRFFEMDRLVERIEAAGFHIEARTTRSPYPDVEVQTTRGYLLARRTAS